MMVDTAVLSPGEPDPAAGARRDRDVFKRPDFLSPILVSEEGYAYRPHELLLSRAAETRFGDTLRQQFGAEPYRPAQAPTEAGAGVDDDDDTSADGSTTANDGHQDGDGVLHWRHLWLRLRLDLIERSVGYPDPSDQAPETAGPVDLAKADLNARLEKAGVRLWFVSPSVDLPELVRNLRETAQRGSTPDGTIDDPTGRGNPVVAGTVVDVIGDGGPHEFGPDEFGPDGLGADGLGAGISLNHVLAGAPRYKGSPGGEPAPANQIAIARMTAESGPQAQLAVLDTGVPKSMSTIHPELVSRMRPDGDDVDLLDADGDGYLDTDAAHGIFIAGLVARLAPDVVIDPAEVLDPTGFGDDASVSAELIDCTAAVINMSFGGYTQDDLPPLGLQLVLTALSRDQGIVAAAGNDGTSRLFWPAAFQGVVAVAALDADRDGIVSPASFTNRGGWVNVCAPGTRLLSSYAGSPEYPAQYQDMAGDDRVFTGWASWDGTSFAAPQVAAAAAARVQDGRAATGREALAQVLAELSASPWPELGLMFIPDIDLRT